MFLFQRSLALIQSSIGFSIFEQYIKTLINNVNKPDDNGNTPLHIACKDRNISIKTIEFFLKHGADPLLTNKADQSAFLLACANEKVTLDIIKLFCKRLAYAKDKQQEKHLGDCLLAAHENKSITVDIIEYLIKFFHGFKEKHFPSIIINFLNKVPKSIKNKSYNIEEILFDQNKLYAKKLLWHCCKLDNSVTHHKLIQLLLENKTSANFVLKSSTALHNACENKNISSEIINLLLKNNGDINISVSGTTPFGILCHNAKSTFKHITSCINYGAAIRENNYKEIKGKATILMNEKIKGKATNLNDEMNNTDKQQSMIENHKYLRFFTTYLSFEQIQRIYYGMTHILINYNTTMPIDLNMDFKYCSKNTRNRVATFFTCMQIHKKNKPRETPPKPVQQLIAKEIIHGDLNIPKKK